MEATSSTTHEQPTKPNKYRELLHSITCLQYESADDALLAIDKAFQAREIDSLEARKLESIVGVSK